MSDTNQRTVGGCLCGSVRYEADGPPICVAYCHCSTCRRHTGAPIVTFVMWAADKVRFTAQDRNIYQSSSGVKRGFCGQCGTPLTWEGRYKDVDIIEFYVGTTDNPDTHVPEWHWHDAERLAWFEVADHLPRYRASDSGAAPYRKGPLAKS